MDIITRFIEVDLNDPTTLTTIRDAHNAGLAVQLSEDMHAVYVEVAGTEHNHATFMRETGFVLDADSDTYTK